MKVLFGKFSSKAVIALLALSIMLNAITTVSFAANTVDYAPAATTDALLNGDFEIDSLSTARDLTRGWHTTNATNISIVEVDAADGNGKDNVAKLAKEISSTNEWLYQPIPKNMAPTGKYNYSFDIKLDGESLTDADYQVPLTIDLVFAKDNGAGQTPIELDANLRTASVFGGVAESTEDAEPGVNKAARVYSVNKTQWKTFTGSLDLYLRSGAWKTDEVYDALYIRIRKPDKRFFGDGDILINNFKLEVPDALQVKKVTANSDLNALSVYAGKLDIDFNYDDVYSGFYLDKAELVKSGVYFVEADTLHVALTDGYKALINNENIYITDAKDRKVDGTSVAVTGQHSIELTYPQLEGNENYKLHIKNLAAITSTQGATNYGYANFGSVAFYAPMKEEKVIPFTTASLDDSFKVFTTVPAKTNLVKDSGFDAGSLIAYTSGKYNASINNAEGSGWIEKSGTYASYDNNNGHSIYIGTDKDDASNKVAIFDRINHPFGNIIQVLPANRKATGVYTIKFKAKNITSTTDDANNPKITVSIGSLRNNDTIYEGIRPAALGGTSDANTVTITKRGEWQEFEVNLDAYLRDGSTYYNRENVNAFVVKIAGVNTAAVNGSEPENKCTVYIDDVEVYAPDALQVNMIDAKNVDAGVISDNGGTIDVNFNHEGIYEDTLTNENVYIADGQGEKVENVSFEKLYSDNVYYTVLNTEPTAKKVTGLRITYPAGLSGDYKLCVKDLWSMTSVFKLGDVCKTDDYLYTTNIGQNEEINKSKFVGMTAMQEIPLKAMAINDYVADFETTDTEVTATFKPYTADYRVIIAQYTADDALASATTAIITTDATGDALKLTAAKQDGLKKIVVYTWEESNYTPLDQQYIKNY